jgi:predicted nucleotidyltransferase
MEGLPMSKIRIRIPRKKIAEFCKRWKVVEFSLFGSILRDDFNPGSDMDVLVTFAPDAQVTLFDMVMMQIELKTLFARDVDLVEKASLYNPYRRHEILQTAKRVYAS